MDAVRICCRGTPPSTCNPRSCNHWSLFRDRLRNRHVFCKEGTHFGGLFPRRPRYWLVFHRRILVRIEYLHGALHRPLWNRRFVRTGGRPFLVACVPFPAGSWLGVSALLTSQQPFSHAR